MSSLSWVSSFASYLMAAMWVAKTSSCSSRTEVTFSWKAKKSSLLSPLIVRFMALMSSFTFWCLSSFAASSSISSAIQSFYLEGAGFKATVGFFIELERPPFSFSRTDKDSFSFAISLGTSLGGYLGCGGSSLLLWAAEVMTLGGILFWEFFGYKICFIFCGFLRGLIYSFLMLLALSALCTYFLASMLLLLSGLA